jgi:hypothetical protein
MVSSVGCRRRSPSCCRSPPGPRSTSEVVGAAPVLGGRRRCDRECGATIVPSALNADGRSYQARCSDPRCVDRRHRGRRPSRDRANRRPNGAKRSGGPQPIEEVVRADRRCGRGWANAVIPIERDHCVGAPPGPRPPGLTTEPSSVTAEPALIFGRECLGVIFGESALITPALQRHNNRSE